MIGLQNISLKQLRYFAAAAESGRLSVAATTMHVSQSTITTAILNLEETLQTRLFLRQAQGVTLTAEGNRFFLRIRHILDALEDAVSDPASNTQDLRGRIRLAASYTLLGYFLPSLMGRFRARHPLVEFDLLDLDREQIESSLEQGSIDLGLVILSNSQLREQFQHSVLIRSRRQLWAAAGHPLLNQGSASLADICEHPYIQITVDEGEVSTRRYWQAAGLSPEIAFRTSSMEALRGLIGHGFGVTILSDMVFRPWSLEGRRIDCVPVLDPVPPMEVGLIWNDATQDECIEVFKEFLIDTCHSGLTKLNTA